MLEGIVGEVSSRMFVMDEDPSETKSRLGTYLEKGTTFEIKKSFIIRSEVIEDEKILWYEIIVKDRLYYVSQDQLHMNSKY